LETVFNKTEKTRNRFFTFRERGSSLWKTFSFSYVEILLKRYGKDPADSAGADSSKKDRISAVRIHRESTVHF